MISKSTFYRRYAQTVRLKNGVRAPTQYGLFLKDLKLGVDINKASENLMFGKYEKEAKFIEKNLG